MWHETAYDGNNVEQYQYRTITCRQCKGEGEVIQDFEDFNIQLIVHAYGKTWKEMHAKYRDWKNRGGRIVCRECNGLGTWEERR